MNDTLTLGNILSWIVGLYIFAHGILNVLRGNDPELGVALILVSFIYFPPCTHPDQNKVWFLHSLHDKNCSGPSYYLGHACRWGS